MKSGKEFHDHEFKNFFYEAKVYGKTVKIRERPYMKDEDTMEIERNLQDIIIKFEERHHNAFGQFDHNVTWNNNDYYMKADFFYRRKTQKLCQGSVSSISLMVGSITIWSSFSMKFNKNVSISVEQSFCVYFFKYTHGHKLFTRGLFTFRVAQSY